MGRERQIALLLSIMSGAAMLYVGLYQSRTIPNLMCPITGEGCHVVADASFARPFGIPDGYIGAALYAVIAMLLIAPWKQRAVWYALIALTSLAALANFLGVRDMVELGSYCFYCLLTTFLSPFLVWLVWQSRAPKRASPGQ